MRRLARVLAVLASTIAATASAAGAQDVRPHHDIALRLAPDGHRIEGRDTLTVRGGGDLELRLLEALEVAHLRVDGEAREVARDGAVLAVDLGEEGRHTIEIGYVGKLQPNRPDGALSAVVQARGSVLPPGAAWYPRTDAARITYRVAVSLPGGQRVVATGRETEQSVDDGTRRAVFEMTDPSEGPAVFAGPYTETRREVDGIVLRTLFPRDRADGGSGALAEDYLDQVAGYIRHYEATIGDYPYPAFSVVAAPFPVGLGFEGATYVSERILDLPYMRGRSLAHEILHSWWGGAVGIAFEEGNWAEGLTTYLADHWVTADRDLTAAEELRRQWLHDFAALPEARRQPLTAFTGKLHDAAQVTGYNKAAMVFHMLRGRLGAETFEAALAGFYEAQRFDTASWADLRAAFEAAAGSDLDGFFEQWLTRPGAPTLAIASAERARGAEGWRIGLRLEQSAPDYALRVPVEVATEAGTARLTVPLARRATNTTIQLDAKPTALAVDPHADLFRDLDPSHVPLTLRHVTLDPETRVVALGVPEETAIALARRLLDTPARAVDAAVAGKRAGPLLLIGTHGALEDARARLGLGATPSEVAGKGSVRAWTVETEARRILAVSADDAAALDGAARALGYYLRRSWVVLDGRDVLEAGTWPTGPDPLRVSFEDKDG